MTRPGVRVRLLAIWLIALLGLGWVVGRQQSAARADLVERFELRVQSAQTFVGAYVDDLADRRGLIIGAHALEESPLGTYLSGVHPARSARAALVDGHGEHVAVGSKGAPLPDTDGRLRVDVPIDETPWRLVATVDEAELFAPIGGIRGVVPWLIYAALGALGLVTVELFARRRAAARELFRAREQAEVAFQRAAIGMALVEVHGGWSRANAPLAEMLGGTDPALLIADDHESLRLLLAGEIPAYTLEKLVPRAGAEIWCQLSVTLIRDADGEPLHFIVQAQDVTEPRRMRAELEELATRDPLTGLWNRRRFEEELAHNVVLARRSGEPAALLMIDVDRFKPVNDTYGHKVGDDLLQEIARAISGRVRGTDGVARLGGDEFGVVLPRASLEDAATVAEEIAEAVRAATVHAGDLLVSTTASVGVSAIDGSTLDADDAMVRADVAMYASKQRLAVAR